MAGIGADRLSLRAAEQLVDRLSGRFADNIPEGDVDAAHGVDNDAAPPIINRVFIHALPERCDFEGVLPDEQFAEAARDTVRGRRLDDGFDDIGRGRDFAEADNPGIGVDADDQRVLRAISGVDIDVGQTEDDGFNIGDFHKFSPQWLYFENK